MRKSFILICLLTSISFLKAQSFVDNIANVEFSGGAQYLEFAENNAENFNNKLWFTGSLALTLNNWYVSGGFLGSNHINYTVGYHLLGQDEFMITAGYQRLDFFADKQFANAAFVQAKFDINDSYFLKLRPVYIFSGNAPIGQPFSMQAEVGINIDLAGNGTGPFRGRTNTSWSSWFSEI